MHVPHDQTKMDLDTANTRRIPRVSCRIGEVVASTDAVVATEIRNISPEGVLATFRGVVSPGERFTLEFHLPHDDRTIRAECRVVYVIGSDEGSLEAGLAFESIRSVHAARIRSFVESALQSQALREVHRSLERDGPEAGVRVETDAREVDSVFKRVAKEGSYVYALVEDQHRVRSCRVDAVLDDGTLVFCDSSSPRCEGEPGTRFFGSFYYGDAGFQFSSIITKLDDDSLFVERPAKLYKSDRRSNWRTLVEKETPIEITPNGTDRYWGTVIDIGPRGLLCSIWIPKGESDRIRVGIDVRFESAAVGELPRFGVVRHRHILVSEQTRLEMQVGVEVGVRAGAFTMVEIDQADWEKKKTEASSSAPIDLNARPVLFRNDDGHMISALLNDASGGRPATVVVIPPAFGKRKESTAPLVATLLSTFADADLPIVTLRYDGINRPGQSHNDADDERRGYEMLRYRPTQGVSDIRTTLRFVEENAAFTAQRVVLITASMSSIDARKLIAEEPGAVDGWVSLMGVPSAQSTLINVLAGTDIISNYRIGIRSGVRGMLGHMVNMDTLARDLIEHDYAFVTDARSDMASIEIPVLWIRGRHDRWVQQEEVEDILTVGSNAPRVLYDIPTGHNLHNSADALEAFRLIAAFLVELVTGDPDPRALLPDPDGLLAMITNEREMVMKPLDSEQIARYWESYLIGDGREGSGYDFYAKLPEFRAFLGDEVRLVDPRPGRRILDAGCGTGLVTERLITTALDRLAPEERSNPVVIDAVDLVPDALEKARSRCRALLTRAGADDAVVVSFTEANLEPDIAEPLADYVAHRELTPGFLRNRIPGVTSKTIDGLESCSIPLLGDLLRGDALPETIARSIEHRLGPELYEDVRMIRAAAQRAREPMQEPFSEMVGRYDAIVASLVLSYIRNPEYLLHRLHTMLVPGGRLVVSTMRPDSDVSTIFTDYIRSTRTAVAHEEEVNAAREMLNEAASLFELEEEGYFRFFSEEELCELCASVGFSDIRAHSSLGTPPQAIIVDCVATGAPVSVWRRYV